MQNEFTFKDMEANKKVSHFVEVMSPFERPCYDFSIQVEKSAEAFAVSPSSRPHPQMEPNVDFNRIDCSLSHDLCDELQIAQVPNMFFLPAEGVAYNNTFPRLPTADSIILYLNDLLGTHRVLDGGLDEDFGRDATLDALANEFGAVRAKGWHEG